MNYRFVDVVIVSLRLTFALSVKLAVGVLLGCVADSVHILHKKQKH